MDKRILTILTFMLFSLAGGHAQEISASQKRQAAFAGTFYPAGKNELASNLQELFKEAGKHVRNRQAGDSEAKVRTLIVPHAGYDYSGMVTAAGYLQIPKNAEYKNIFIITNSHRRPFEGISVCLSSAYQTPLGELEVNQQIARALISQHEQIVYNEAAHEREQGIEVQLPFIKYHFDQAPSIVPLVIGSSSIASARDLASALLPWYTAENLFIISADFSRYPSYSDAVRIDKITADAVMSGNPEKFYSTLRDVSKEPVENLSTPSGDWTSIMTLLYMAHQDVGIMYEPLLYRNSGDSPLGSRDRVVGYWAIAGHQKLSSDSPLTLNNEEKSILLEISRSTLDSYIGNNTIPALPSSKLTPLLKKPANVLVSLYMGDRLRGRLEYLSPPVPMASMTQEMTIAAAVLDKRFSPVLASELDYISIELSVLSPLRKISNINEIDPEKHGIYLSKDEHRGLLLPGMAAQKNWTIEDLLGHCAREKAGLGREDWKNADLYIFEAITFREQDLNPSSSPLL